MDHGTILGALLLVLAATPLISVLTKPSATKLREKEKAARNEIIHSTVSSYQINAELVECYRSPHEEHNLVIAVKVSATHLNSVRMDECHIELGNGYRLNPRPYTTPKILRDDGQYLIFHEGNYRASLYTPEQSITFCITEGRTGKDYQTGKPLPSVARRIVRHAS